MQEQSVGLNISLVLSKNSLNNKPSGLIVTDEGMESSNGMSLAEPKVLEVIIGISLVPQNTSRVQSFKRVHIHVYNFTYYLLPMKLTLLPSK